MSFDRVQLAAIMAKFQQQQEQQAHQALQEQEEQQAKQAAALSRKLEKSRAEQAASGTVTATHKFLAAFYQTGSIDFTSASDNQFHTPSIENQFALYLLGYRMRNAGLMQAVVLRVEDSEIQEYIPIVAKIWEDTYAMCSEMRMQCSLRRCLFEKFLHAVHVYRTMNRADFTDTAIFPATFQNVFFDRLDRLEKGRYILNKEYLNLQTWQEWQKPKARKAWNAQEMHDRVIQKLESKRGSPSTQGGENRDPELRALECYMEAFPNGALIVQTSPEKYLCGLDSICKSTKAQHPSVSCPTVSQLEAIVASEEYRLEAEAFVLTDQQVNNNYFSGDQLAKILDIWGKQCGQVFQLGWVTNEGLPHLFPCANEAEAKVLWIHNDDAEEAFASFMVAAHWSALEAFGM